MLGSVRNPHQDKENMEQDAALRRLQLLLKEGALKIILPFHTCSKGLVTDEDITKGDAKVVGACESYAKQHEHVAGMAGGYQSVGHYRLADVQRLEPATKAGVYTAYADDDLGSSCTGTPAALLARLTEHER